jgi:hypothetical protein
MRIAAALLAALLIPAVYVSAAYASPTRAEFIRKGDAVCRQTKRELAPILKRAKATKQLPLSQQWDALADIWADQIVIQKRFTARFKAIGVPAGDATARALVALLDRGVVLAQRVRQGFAAHDAVLLQSALPAYLRLTFSTNKQVIAYGFHTCGR